MKTNKFGLSRNIPAAIKREIRQRSKNGCVVCRCGVYQYEHIYPEYKDAYSHQPEAICCLCAKCHDKVTRGLLSKQFVFQAYKKVQASEEIDNPREFFDFHTGEAKLLFGNIVCDPTPKSILCCYGTNVFSVEPGTGDEPGKVNAIFHDDKGKLAFQIIGNEWIGPTSSFDLNIVGQRFTVRLPGGRVSLKLRHEPPGKIIIEELDMRYQDIHLLASEFDFALGKYTGYDKNLIWLHVKARIDQLFSQPVAIEVNKTDAQASQYQKGLSAEKPRLILNQIGLPEYALVTDRELSQHYNLTQCGIHWPDIGFQIAKGCEFALCAVAAGVCSIEHARQHFFAKNRMNVPTLYLPAIINAANLAEETTKPRLDNKRTNQKSLKEPFLMLKDSSAIKKWHQRQKQSEKTRDFVATPFLDDKPGCYFATGTIKLNDAYNGPALRVKRLNKRI